MDTLPKWSSFPEPQRLSAEEALASYSNYELLVRIDNGLDRHAWAAEFLSYAAKEGWTGTDGIPELIDCAGRRGGGSVR